MCYKKTKLFMFKNDGSLRSFPIEISYFEKTKSRHHDLNVLNSCCIILASYPCYKKVLWWQKKKKKTWTEGSVYLHL